jgi:hypothetical protein
MALRTKSTLEPFRFERVRSSLKPSLLLILAWGIWLSLVSGLLLSNRLSIHGTGFVLLIGAFWWTLIEGAFYILLMSFIMSAFSLTPSGFFWVAAFFIFSLCRLGSYRFTLSTPIQILFVILLIAFALDLTQGILLNRILSERIFSFKLFGSLIYSSSLQAVLGWLFSRPILTLIEAK